MKIKQTHKALNILKQATTIQCITLDDNEDIEMNFFDPNVELDEEIPELVIGGVFGNIFTDDLSDSVIQDNTITTKNYKITIIK
jgi:hypothetical protein